MTETNKPYISNEVIIKEFARAVDEGRIKLADIPQAYKEKVEEILNKS